MLSCIEKKNGKFYEEKGIKFYHRSYLYRHLSQWFSFLILKSPLFAEFKENLLIKYLREEKRLLEEKYPDIKFVVLLYPSLYGRNDFFSIEDKIQKQGILTIDGREIFLKEKNREVWADESYYLPNAHPNEESYSILVPEIAKQLKL